MTRKLYFLFSIPAILLPGLLQAQINVAKANVGVIVTASQSMVVSSENLDDQLPLSKKIDNKENVRLGDINQIHVFSSGKFVVKVSARNDFNDLDGPEIPASAVYVSSGATSNNAYKAGDYVFEKDVNLTVNQPKALIHAQNAGSLNNSFNIEYYASGLNDDNMRHGSLDGTVVYTIEVE